MAAGSTYTPIATVTAPGGSSSQLVMSSIPSTYTDLVLVSSCRSAIASTGNLLYARINGDSATNYSFNMIYGDGSGAFGDISPNGNYINVGITTGASDPSGSFATNVTHFMNYANTTTYKTLLNRGAATEFWSSATISLWRSTAAINSITVYPAGLNNWIAGSTFTLYGIAAA